MKFCVMILVLFAVVFPIEFNHTTQTKISFSGDMPKSFIEASSEETVVPKDAVYYDHHPEFGSITFTKDDMIQYIQSVNYNVSREEAYEIADAVIEASDEYGLSPTIVLGLAAVESDFRRNVVSEKGAIGLMQVTPATWLKAGNRVNLQSQGIVKYTSELYNISQNVRAGSYVLAHYRDNAIRKNIEHPMKYALTRYFGGKTNSHSAKTFAKIKQFVAILA